MSAHPSGDDLGRYLRVIEALGPAKDGEHLAYEDIEAFVDGGLDEIAREAVDAHAAACAACAAEIADLAAFRASLRQPRAPEAPTRVIPMRVRTRRIPRLAPWLAAAAVLVLAVTVARRTGAPVPATAVPVPDPAPQVGRPAVVQPSTTPAAQEPAAPAAATAPAPVPEPAPAPRLRGGARRVAGKAFRFESGVWVDEAYDSLALLPEQTASGAARAALIAREPALAPFGALGSRVVVVHGGTVYRLEP